MALSREEVEHVALLARLRLTAEEMETHTHHLNQILDAFRTLEELDTADVPPTSHAIPMSNVFRVDQVRPCLPREEALANAPDQDGEYFRVPRVVE